MRIVVCVKQVPDTTEVRIDPKTGTLIREGVPSIINPDDLAGIEAALILKEKTDGHVTVVTMGPPQAEEALREAYAMGVDEAILISDRAFAGADTWATSSTLAAALQKLTYDVIITGRQAIDGDTAQVGPQIAEHLKLPQVSYAESIDLDEKHPGKLTVRRKFEDRAYLLRVPTPCLLTALSELNTPRYMRVGSIYGAYEKTVTKWSLEDLIIDKTNIGLKGSPTRVKKAFTKGAKTAGKLYEVTPDEAVNIIINKLTEKFII